MQSLPLATLSLPDPSSGERSKPAQAVPTDKLPSFDEVFIKAGRKVEPAPNDPVLAEDDSTTPDTNADAPDAEKKTSAEREPSNRAAQNEVPDQDAITQDSAKLPKQDAPKFGDGDLSLGPIPPRQHKAQDTQQPNQTAIEAVNRTAKDAPTSPATPRAAPVARPTPEQGRAIYASAQPVQAHPLPAPKRGDIAHAADAPSAPLTGSKPNARTASIPPTQEAPRVQFAAGPVPDKETALPPHHSPKSSSATAPAPQPVQSDLPVTPRKATATPHEAPQQAQPATIGKSAQVQNAAPHPDGPTKLAKGMPQPALETAIAARAQEAPKDPAKPVPPVEAQTPKIATPTGPARPQTAAQDAPAPVPVQPVQSSNIPQAEGDVKPTDLAKTTPLRVDRNRLQSGAASAAQTQPSAMPVKAAGDTLPVVASLAPSRPVSDTLHPQTAVQPAQPLDPVQPAMFTTHRPGKEPSKDTAHPLQPTPSAHRAPADAAITAATTTAPSAPTPSDPARPTRKENSARADFTHAPQRTPPQTHMPPLQTLQWAAKAQQSSLETPLSDRSASEPLFTTSRSETGVQQVQPQQHAARLDLPPQVARQLAEVITQMPGRPVEIALSPEELGRVRMSVKVSDTGIAVSLMAERPETLDLLRRHIDQLGADFQAMGYENIAFSFAGGDANPDPSDSSADPTPAPFAPLEESDATPVLVVNADGASGLDLRL